MLAVSTQELQAGYRLKGASKQCIAKAQFRELLVGGFLRDTCSAPFVLFKMWSRDTLPWKVLGFEYKTQFSFFQTQEGVAFPCPL